MNPRATYAAALAVPLAVCALLALDRTLLDGTNVTLLLVLVVVGAAATGSRLAGVLAALSSVTWFDFFLTRPYLTFTIGRRDDVESAVLLVLVGLAVTEIALWGRRQQGGASRREGYLTGVVSASSMVASGSSPDDVVRYAEKQLRVVLGVDRCRYLSGRPGGAHPRIERDGTLTVDGVVIRAERSGLPTTDVVDLPVENGVDVLGRFEITASTRVARPTLEQRRVAVTLAEVVGSALTPRAREDAVRDRARHGAAPRGSSERPRPAR